MSEKVCPFCGGEPYESGIEDPITYCSQCEKCLEGVDLVEASD